ncbi:hypothetical protein PILCRDRAFT_5719 [Piloderma croceum F 1598]|uniref:Uncharacterized protein n=1 Tax=Piloderma croceum (strain F 1598) TaxID=765440 RepID=A0A0C3G036_PILCF|nr:hypothetical protein PILCRDRAFT_5719 [Piloderma croceum F 1598]
MYISPSKAILPSSSYTDEEEEQPPRAIHLRHARGGRWFIDKRLPASRAILGMKDTSHIFFFRRPHERDSIPMAADGDMHNEECLEVAGQDDSANVNKQDRVLVDDYKPRSLRHSITLLHDQDQQSVVTDNSLTVTGPDGRMQSHHTIPTWLTTAHDTGRRPTWPEADGIQEDATSCWNTPASVSDIFERRYASFYYSSGRQHVVESAHAVVPCATAS